MKVVDFKEIRLDLFVFFFFINRHNFYKIYKKWQLNNKLN